MFLMLSKQINIINNHQQTSRFV